MHLSLTSDEISEKICELLGDTMYNGSRFYKEIQNTINDLNQILNKSYTFKESNICRGNLEDIAIPFEISNLFAVFVALKNEFKTFDMVSRNNIGSKNYSKIKHPTKASMSQDEIDKLTCLVDVDEVTSFIIKILQYLKNDFSEMETVAFVENFHYTGAADSFKIYDELIMLQKQYVHFFKTVCENFDQDSIRIITEMRLYLQKYAYNIQCRNKHQSELEHIMTAETFASIYMKIRDTIAYSIEDILSRTHDEKNKRVNLHSLTSESFKKKFRREFKSYDDVLLGNKIDKRRNKNLKKVVEQVYAENTILNNPISYYKSKNFGDFSNENINKLFDNILGCISGIIINEVQSLTCTELLKYQINKKRINLLRELYHYTDLYNLSDIIDGVLDKFYQELEYADLSDPEIFIDKQAEIVLKKIDEIKVIYSDYWEFYKKSLVENGEDQRYFNEDIESILSNVCKKEKYQQNEFEIIDHFMYPMDIPDDLRKEIQENHSKFLEERKGLDKRTILTGGKE